VLKKLLTALCLSCLIAGCGPTIKSGAVLDKQFVPAHTETNLRYDAALQTTVTDIDDVPDRWYLTIGKKCEDGEYRTRTVAVPQDQFDRTKNGDWYSEE
jgi:hypothetical protein